MSISTYIFEKLPCLLFLLRKLLVPIIGNAISKWWTLVRMKNGWVPSRYGYLTSYLRKKYAPMHVVVRPVSLAGRVILCDLIIIGEKSPDWCFSPSMRRSCGWTLGRTNELQPERLRATSLMVSEGPSPRQEVVHRKGSIS